MTEEIVSYGVLSLIPAILAVVLAFWTKNGFEQVDEGHYIVMERDIQTARRGI